MKTKICLLSIGQDAKTVKGQKFGYYTGIQYLSPSDECGVINTCPNASKGCRQSCLYTAGRANVFKKINHARVNRTLLFANNKDEYFKTLIGDITKLVKKAKKNNFSACVRLNGTSDISWESEKFNDKNIFEIFPDVQFYDYTKSARRMLDFVAGKLNKNYYLTFSRSENNDKQVLDVLRAGMNVAVVFDKLPQSYLGYKVIDADESDLRFNDVKNVVCGLKAKGKARKDISGFVVKTIGNIGNS